MLIYVTTDNALIAGSRWPKGTRLEAPDRAAQAAVKDGLATFDLPADKPAPKVAEPAEPEAESETPKRRGRPPKAD